MEEYVEVVIKIPRYYLEHPQYYSYLAECVRRGTVLPKGHGRLIDADVTILKICGSSCGCHLEECGHDEPCFSVTRIKSVPTIIEANKESENTK